MMEKMISVIRRGLCPLREKDCIMDVCEWFDRDTGKCAILSILEILRDEVRKK